MFCKSYVFELTHQFETVIANAMRKKLLQQNECILRKYLLLDLYTLSTTKCHKLELTIFDWCELRANTHIIPKYAWQWIYLLKSLAIVFLLFGRVHLDHRCLLRIKWCLLNICTKEMWCSRSMNGAFIKYIERQFSFYIFLVNNAHLIYLLSYVMLMTDKMFFLSIIIKSRLFKFK